jgi:hypothetical protein
MKPGGTSRSALIGPRTVRFPRIVPAMAAQTEWQKGQFGTATPDCASHRCVDCSIFVIWRVTVPVGCAPHWSSRRSRPASVVSNGRHSHLVGRLWMSIAILRACSRAIVRRNERAATSMSASICPAGCAVVGSAQRSSAHGRVGVGEVTRRLAGILAADVVG